MVPLAIAFVSTLGVIVAAFVSVLKALIRSHARREDLLVNQLLHATGKTWTPPPAEERPRRELGDDLTRLRFTASPEQLPVD